MTVNYTTNLALGQPVTGTESGTWGDDVNNAVTSYLDIAIAGGLAITITTADVTLTNTQGTSSATNIGSTTAQYAILNISGAKTAARNLIVPSSSRHYIINNSAATGGYLLTVKGAATTGITLVDGEKAVVAWNGSDYVKIASNAISNSIGYGTGVATALAVNVGTAGAVVVNGGALGTPSSGSGSSLTFGTGTLSLAGNTTHAGAFTQSFTATANTAVTLPAGATAGSNNLLSSATAVAIVTGSPSASTYLRGDGTWSTVSGGTVTSVSVTSGNGFAGTVATSTSTPAITLSTSITGLLFGNGTAIAAATISSPLSYATGTLSIPVATTSANGYLSSTDWTTFNGKAASGANADITSMTALTSISRPSASTATAVTVTGQTSTGIGVAGGAVSLTAGAGASSSTANGTGGAVNITGGAGGSTSAGTGGTGGAISIVGGAGSTTNSNATPGVVSITGGASGLSGQFGAGVTISGSAGFAGAANATGGSVTISGGSGGSTGTTGTGGSITINSGAGTGSAGQAGSINFNLGATTSAHGTVNFQQGTTTKAFIDSSGNLFTGAATATLPTNSGTVSTGTQFGFKNKLINGNYIISNNTAGASGTGSGNTFNYTIDRWIAGSSNNATVSFSTTISTSSATSPWPTPSMPTVLITNTAGSTGTLLFAQRIEANNIADLYSTNVTFSLYCATSGSVTVTWTTYYPNTANTWTAATTGTNSSISLNATQIDTGTFTTTASLAYKTFTTNIGSSAFTNGLMIVFSVVNAAASSTVTFGPVQMERGSTPTPFEFRAFGTELELCQRYFEKVGCKVYSTLPTAPYSNVPFRVQKRTTSTLSYTQASGSGAVFSAAVYTAPSGNPMIYQSTASSGASDGVVTMNAEL